MKRDWLQGFSEILNKVWMNECWQCWAPLEERIIISDLRVLRQDKQGAAWREVSEEVGQPGPNLHSGKTRFKSCHLVLRPTDLMERDVRLFTIRHYDVITSASFRSICCVGSQRILLVLGSCRCPVKQNSIWGRCATTEAKLWRKPSSDLFTRDVASFFSVCRTETKWNMWESVGRR